MKIKESEKVNKYLDLASELKKIVEHKNDSDTNRTWRTWNSPQRLKIVTARTENQCKNRDHSDYSMVEIGKNTAKSPGDLRRRDVNHIPVKEPQLTLILKTHTIIICK